MSPTRRQLLRTGVVAAGVGLAGCNAIPGERVRETITREFDAVPRLAIENTNGDVTIEPTGGDVVELRMVKSTAFGRDRFDLVTLAVERADDTLSLTVDREDDESTVPRVAVDMTVRVPEGSGLDAVQTANGDVTVSEVAAAPADGHSELATSNGDVEVHQFDGYPVLRTNNGEIDVSGGPGLAEARTANGDIEVEIRRFEGDVACSSTNGDIEVAIAPGLDADISARTSNGRVTVEELPTSAADSSRGRFEGRLNAGGVDVVCSTTNGDVDIGPLNGN